jgi:hypothetical protein
MTKISMKSRQEVIKRYYAKYKKSSKKEKGQILDSLCLSTGLSRDRVKKLLSGCIRKATVPGSVGNSTKKRGRKPKYDDCTRAALEKIWALMDFACGRRLAAGMEDMLDALLRFDEIKFDKQTLENLRKISPATIDRLLKRAKSSMSFKGISATKPGTLLKRDIPVRLGTQWDEAVPGYVEIDLVAHCGITTAGEYINTLDVTDIYSGWTETEAVLNKAQKHVFEALMDIKERLPFNLLGIDSDNGSEFINAHLLRYCQQEGICFTRSRENKKNDSCHVEQKNWSVVRRNIGYDRYEGEAALRAMNEYYELLRLYMNFFLPSVKLLSKNRDGAKIRKKYEPPQTPYKRLISSPHIENEEKKHLKEIWLTLNPAELKRGMMKLLDQLLKLKAKS